MYIGLHVKYSLFLPDVNEISISRTDIKKYSHIKFNEYPPSGSRAVPYGLTGRRIERRIDGWYGQRHDVANSRFA